MSWEAIAGRVRMMLARAVIAGVNDLSGVQAVQLDVLDEETLDEVERFGAYGLASHPLPGAEAILAFIGGLRSHGIVLGVEDRRYRLKVAPGEVALYDDLGQKVHLTRDGIKIESTKPVTVKTPHAIIDAPRVDLAGEGGKAVARVGDAVEGGKIVAGSPKVFAA